LLANYEQNSDSNCIDGGPARRPNNRVRGHRTVLRTETSFAPMALVLENNGYKVINRGYPSTQNYSTVVQENLPADVAASVDARVNFVTHSMGGIPSTRMVV
jgi:hypothetical protein